MIIRVLTVGSIEDKSLNSLAENYIKRIKRYTRIELESVQPQKIKSLSVGEILHREAERIENKLSVSEDVIVLDKEGKQLSSEEFAQLFIDLAKKSTKRATFIIGGPHGLAEEIKKGRSCLSFGRITIPHELMAVLLLEQIYRAQTILKGEKYHK